MIKLLFIGDVISEPGCKTVRNILPKIKRDQNIDVVVANAENSAQGNGISAKSAKSLFESGCDVLTGGNHTLRRHNSYAMLNENRHILRPYNLSRFCPGRGVCVIDKGKYSIAVINLIGQTYLDANSSPFEEINNILKNIDTPLIFIDFHAEATGEKAALAHYLDGKVSAIIGTHTHVQTNDARVLDNGTGFLTDVGMVGPYDSILGVDPKCVLRRITTKMATRFEVRDSKCIFNAAVVELDEITGKCLNISTISIF